MRIILVEDEPGLAEMLRRFLERERFVVDHLDCLAAAGDACAMVDYDLALLDRTLPDGDGLALVGALRQRRPGIPIIMLSARGDIGDRVTGLDHGADDYLVKPFALDEMLARIRAVSRRPSQMQGDRIEAGAVVFEPATDAVEVSGQSMTLPRRELRVLAALIRRRGRTVMRETLEQAVFGFDDEIQSNTLDSHVSRLRRRLREADAGVEIHAIRGVGYLLRAAP
ncbi:response regulator transcription factor [Paracoccus gahaiensis]|uniref:Response regulator transcription factor n=1 Tax=Paracoccus gahaiensis TaxID=1706839 RepID=A0A4U0RLR0_9RHOB|nr:response regulator transcription factor [Paracoccus gahaiensis]TJZ88994.1 response regulator transcription factor [Paracoccus gahaiensis]